MRWDGNENDRTEIIGAARIFVDHNKTECEAVKITKLCKLNMVLSNCIETDEYAC